MKSLIFTSGSLVALGLMVLASSTLAAPSPAAAEDAEKEIAAAIDQLDAADRDAARAQRWCPVALKNRLGAMGTPVKVELEGKQVFLCCEQCLKQARDSAKATVAKAEKLKKASAALARLPSADRKLAESQRYCAVQTKNELGSMGTPIKLVLDGEPVFLCCAGCKKSASAKPAATATTARRQRAQYEAAQP